MGYPTVKLTAFHKNIILINRPIMSSQVDCLDQIILTGTRPRHKDSNITDITDSNLLYS